MTVCKQINIAIKCSWVCEKSFIPWRRRRRRLPATERRRSLHAGGGGGESRMMMIFSLNADSAAELPLRRRPSQFGVCIGGGGAREEKARRREDITLNLKSTKDEMRPMKCESKNLVVIVFHFALHTATSLLALTGRLSSL